MPVKLIEILTSFFNFYDMIRIKLLFTKQCFLHQLHIEMSRPELLVPDRTSQYRLLSGAKPPSRLSRACSRSAYRRHIIANFLVRTSVSENFISMIPAVQTSKLENSISMVPAIQTSNLENSISMVPAIQTSKLQNSISMIPAGSGPYCGRMLLCWRLAHIGHLVY